MLCILKCLRRRISQQESIYGLLALTETGPIDETKLTYSTTARGKLSLQ